MGPHDQPTPGSEDIRQDAIDRILATSLTWVPTTVDLLHRDLTAGGTGQPAPAAYHLLPDSIAADSIAADILQLAPLSLGIEQIRFLRTPTPNGAELISWPPREAHDGRGCPRSPRASSGQQLPSTMRIPSS